MKIDINQSKFLKIYNRLKINNGVIVLEAYQKAHRINFKKIYENGLFKRPLIVLIFFPVLRGIWITSKKWLVGYFFTIGT